MKKFTLLIDTSTMIGLCAIARKKGDGSYEVIAEEYISAELSHSERIFKSMKDLLEKAGVGFDDIDRVVYCSGPGSFTGLRISYSAVKGFLTSKGIEHSGVSTLKALVKSYGPCGTAPVCAVMKSGKDEFFAYCVKEGKELIKEACYTGPDLIAELDKLRSDGLICVGDASFCKELRVSAKGMLSVLEEGALDGINYLKASYAEKRRGSNV